MQQVLAQSYAVIHSWTYVAIALSFAAALLALRLRVVGNAFRVTLLASTIAVLTGALGFLIPWFGRSIYLEPGPIEAFTRAIVYPLYYSAISVPPLVLILLVLASTLVFGRVFCGWICPVGILQELVAVVRSHRLIRVSRAVCNASRSLLLLSFVLLLIWKRRSLYDLVDPYPALGAVSSAGPFAFVALGVVGIGSLRIYRPFCSLICPLGLMAHFIASRSAFRIAPTSECNGCGACFGLQSCPGLQAAVLGYSRPIECYACGSCMRACPLKAVRYSLRRSFPNRQDGELRKSAAASAGAGG